MTREPKPYQRLPGHGSSAFESVRLYLGTDHLLQVAFSGFTESYRRFYFRDIQTMTLRKSLDGQVWNGVWGFLAFLLGVVALESNDTAGSIVWGGLTGIFLVLLLINVARGPTCVCQIRTAVQTRTLPSLNRLRSASKVIARLRPLIDAAQGALPRDEITRRLDEARQGTIPVSPGPAAVTSSPSPF